MRISLATADLFGGIDALRERVNAFRSALEAHRFTVDEPAPTEDALIERIARSTEEIEVEALPPAPQPEPKRSWTLSEFKARLQPGELAALGGLLGRTLEPADAALLLDFLTATTLSLAPPGGPDGKLERGLARLVALGVLTDARRQALLQPE